LSFVGRGEALRGQQISAAEMISDNAHFIGVVVVLFVRDFLEFLDDRRHERNLEDVEATDCGRSKTLKSAAEVDVFVL